MERNRSAEIFSTSFLHLIANRHKINHTRKPPKFQKRIGFHFKADVFAPSRERPPPSMFSTVDALEHLKPKKSASLPGKSFFPRRRKRPFLSGNPYRITLRHIPGKIDTGKKLFDNRKLPTTFVDNSIHNFRLEITRFFPKY
jgi:hypothetical protein